MSLWHHPHWCGLSLRARLLCFGLFDLAYRHGGPVWDPDLLRQEFFPNDRVSDFVMERCRRELVDGGFILPVRWGGLINLHPDFQEAVDRLTQQIPPTRARARH